MEYKIAEEISEFRKRATREECICLVERIFEVIKDARDSAISANTFEHRIEKTVEDLDSGSCVIEDDGVIKISVTSLYYPDPEYFKIVYKHIPDTSECIVLRFDHIYETGTVDSYVSPHQQLPTMGGPFSPKTIPIETAQYLLEMADRQEWCQIEKILDKPITTRKYSIQS